MAYDAPTIADLQARYPAFAAVADPTVQVWLTNAENFVDESWIEADYAPAIMAHAADQMERLGIGTQTGVGALPAGVTSFKSGAMGVTISEAVAVAAAKGGYASTVYGREFLLLQRRNFGGPRVIASTTTSACA